MKYPPYLAMRQEIADMFSNIPAETSRQDVEQFYQNIEEFSHWYPQMFWDKNDEQEFIVNDHLRTWIYQQTEMWQTDCNLERIAQAYNQLCKAKGGTGFLIMRKVAKIRE